MILALILSLFAPSGGGLPPANRFTLDIAPTTIAPERGESAEITITLTLAAGAAETATLSVHGLPEGVTGAFDDDTISTDGGTATLTISIASDAPPTVVADLFQVRATAPSQTKTRNATVPVPDFYTYFRPGGVFTYFQPDGVSTYLRP